MSVAYTPVGWTRTKIVYDAVLLAGVGAYLTLFPMAAQQAVLSSPLDGPALRIKAFGTCAFLLLTLVLCIGPLARLDARFLPLLYNRRHFGVVTATVAFGHAMAVMGWYFSFSPVAPFEALLSSDASYGQIRGFPFIPFGIAALGCLSVLAVTSHDFWLAFLGPRLWKALHLGVYAAYALVVAHVAFGPLQDYLRGGFAWVVLGSVAGVTALHLAAARRPSAGAPREGPWVVAGEVAAIPEGRGIVVPVAGGEPVAIFRHGGRLSAVSNLCAHQNGPLGEGRVLDGCITCPWHGFQYRLEDGCAPAPFTEKIATYRLARDGGRLLLDPRPNPPGTRVEPLSVEDAA